MVRWEKNDLGLSIEKGTGSLVQTNQNLLSLGIVLIELHFGKCLEECSGPSGPKKTLNRQDMADMARNLVHSVYDTAGDLYGDAVRRCVLGLDYRETRLEMDEFKMQVMYSILIPLEEHFRIFCGE